MRSANPALSDKTFADYTPIGIEPKRTDTMTLDGTVNKTVILVLTVFGCALIPWNMHFSPTGPQNVMPFLIGGAIVGFITALVTIFNASISPFTAPIYAISKGFFLGALSAFFETMYPGIAVQAIFLTLTILFSLLLAYKSGMIKVTENFKLGVVAATGGIFLFYLVAIIGRMFFDFHMPMIHSSGLMGIGFSLFVIVIASLNLVLDFDFIEEAAENNTPKFMEWYGAFGLLVTLVWLYVEILHLLAKLNSDD